MRRCRNSLKSNVESLENIVRNSAVAVGAKRSERLGGLSEAKSLPVEEVSWNFDVEIYVAKRKSGIKRKNYNSLTIMYIDDCFFKIIFI